MAIFTRRATGTRKLRRQLDGDMRHCGDLAVEYAGAADDGSFDVLAFTIRAFELGLTTDIELLITHGIDGREFFLRELKPNWADLSREERAARIAAFVRFANLLDGSGSGSGGGAPGEEPLAELRATVRTKIVLLAGAYDLSYGDHYGRAIARNPQRFGEYDLPDALARAT